MNKEKLIDTILKDIDELKDISEEIKNDGAGVLLETNIALSKATLIFQEFQLLKEKYILKDHQPFPSEAQEPVINTWVTESPVGSVPEEIQEQQEPEKISMEEKIPEPVEEETEEKSEPEEEADSGETEEEPVSEENDYSPEEQPEENTVEEKLPEQQEEQPEENITEEKLPEQPEEEVKEDLPEPEEQPEEETVPEETAEEQPEEKETPEEEVEETDDEETGETIEEEETPEEEETDIEENSEEEEENDDSEEENDNGEDEDENSGYDDEPQPTNRTIGENFHSEASLNDRFGHQENTLDQKIARSSVTSLQSSIGINDRFLFTREIFNNDADLYSRTIEQIDNCRNIREAVDYLSSHFRIKRTETSLRFVDLIKRRFAQ